MKPYRGPRSTRAGGAVGTARTERTMRQKAPVRGRGGVGQQQTSTSTTRQTSTRSRPYTGPTRTPETTITTADDNDDFNSGFSGWLRSPDGIEYMKLFVIANSIIMLTTVGWPHITKTWEILQDLLSGYKFIIHLSIKSLIYSVLTMLSMIFRGVFILAVIAWYTTGIWKGMTRYYDEQFKKYLDQELENNPRMREHLHGSTTPAPIAIPPMLPEHRKFEQLRDQDLDEYFHDVTLSNIGEQTRSTDIDTEDDQGVCLVEPPEGPMFDDGSNTCR